MHLPEAYRSLARPLSALEPSHSPDGIFARIRLTELSERLGRKFIRGIILAD